MPRHVPLSVLRLALGATRLEKMEKKYEMSLSPAFDVR